MQEVLLFHHQIPSLMVMKTKRNFSIQNLQKYMVKFLIKVEHNLRQPAVLFVYDNCYLQHVPDVPSLYNKVLRDLLDFLLEDYVFHWLEQEQKHLLPLYCDQTRIDPRMSHLSILFPNKKKLLIYLFV